MKAELVENRNDDLTVVNAARVSFDKQVDKISVGDTRLIDYLATHNHWTPFAHCRFTFIGSVKVLVNVPLETELREGLVFSRDRTKVRHSFYGWVQLLKADYVRRCYRENIIEELHKAMPVSCAAFDVVQSSTDDNDYKIQIPENETDPRFIDFTLRETVPVFVARQRFKHMVDFDYNEVSRRYVSDTPDFFFPDTWRGKPTDGAKQGSSGEMSVQDQKDFNEFLHHHHMSSIHFYKMMIEKGVSPEQARMALPQSMMTNYYVTGSLQAWRRAYGLRIDKHAQKEIRDLAVMWGDVIEGVKS